MRRKSDKINMEGIAKKLGVSMTTVHYAIHNTGRLSEATRIRVLALVKSSKYRPNGLARSFRRRQTDTIGVVMAGMTSSFHLHLLEGIERVSQNHRHAMLVSCSRGSSQMERDLVEVFLERGADGIIIVPTAPEKDQRYYRDLLAEGVALVFADRNVPGLDVDLVTTDHELGACMIARHLIRLGRSKLICVLDGPLAQASSSVRDRLAGVGRALQEAGLEPALTLHGHFPDWTIAQEYGYRLSREHLKNDRTGFDGVFAVNDGVAFGVLSALAETGLTVPKDVAVVGFDDQDASAYHHPPLTTVRQPASQIGMEAGNLLFRRLAQREAAPPQRIVLEPTLVVRESCGAAIQT